VRNWQGFATRFEKLGVVAGANPHLGAVGVVAQVAEYRVELMVQDACVAAVVAALKAAHPYEEPAYAVLKLESF